MKKVALIAFIAIAVCCGSASAEDIKSVGIQTASGQQLTAIDDLRRIDVSSEQVTLVKNTDQGSSYALDEVRKIYFSTESSAIEDIAQDQVQRPTIFVTADGSSVTISPWDEKIHTRATIHAIDGKELIAVPNWNGTPISISSLPSGVYIIVAGSASGKFIK